MSGHSKWHNIAKRKGANDAKKAKIFTKIGREMAIAIKEGGSANPDFNARLRDCIAKAKANNMPNDNIKRTLDKYSGANGQVNYEANNYEGYGVGGVAVVVETLTDNKNRTVADVRHLFDKYGAGLGATNCVSWQFDKKGVIIMERGELDEDTVMMQALEAGAEDFQADEETFEIYTTPDDFSAVREALETLGYSFVEAEVEMVPQNYITLEKEEDMAQMRKLLDNLEDNDDVQAVWHNWENEDDYEG
ncbi:YebC/PmpR family DNA-binding transcriptional regulator [Agathobaculum sp. NSJ-28]|uniref:Probable transcriptional regulatory protein H8S45_12700 n=2 Tax=Agathobaculum TaxID=2048137 RepID=A0A923RWS8_9FIRM|nr:MULTISPECIES: YebC/PmpR family DNA-binding transcriptional regulator [Butyricicoccaceae]MBS6883094.1 YebC/PmpR family DNA-binding transcriptional regulator [Clostridiaceae bacterium]SCJ39060.1 Probable transcriptional regulatory protein YebC [uncultured Butyricicoccus sp.]MBC5726313.1 YebC/PmpR family DNA-binding transcriptional regulator [Agathobaculum faecis]MCU6789820.1 YebC/PmpR family DNA-binding transcriptional regulator [Agathobaculum ammoniilyticum]WOC75690.1 YebC/PmpR family DNA-bi